MARRMTEALAEGRGDHTSPTVKAVAKSLGVNPTASGLKAFLSGVPAPTAGDKLQAKLDAAQRNYKEKVLPQLIAGKITPTQAEAEAAKVRALAQQVESSGLRGTQNPNNLAAIVENRQANAADAPVKVADAVPQKGTKIQAAPKKSRSIGDAGRMIIGEAEGHMMQVSRETEGKVKFDGRRVDTVEKAKAYLKARGLPATLAEIKAKERAPKSPATMPSAMATVPPRDPAVAAAKRAEGEARRAAIVEAERAADARMAKPASKRSPAKTSTSAPAALTSAAQSAGVRDPNAAMKDVFGSGMKPTAAVDAKPVKATPKRSKTSKALSVLGPAAVVGAAAVAFDATRSEAQAAGNSTATTLAKSTAAATVAGGTVAATMWGIGKGVQVAGGALAAVAPRAAAVLVPGGAMVLGGLAAYSAGKAAVEGYRKDGLKGAAVGVGDWATMGAVSHFGPRLTASGASQFETANAAYTAMKGNEATNTESARKPGWGPEARIAAAKAQGAVMLPYGGNPANAPGYVPPAKSKPNK